MILCHSFRCLRVCLWLKVLHRVTSLAATRSCCCRNEPVQPHRFLLRGWDCFCLKPPSPIPQHSLGSLARIFFHLFCGITWWHSFASLKVWIGVVPISCQTGPWFRVVFYLCVLGVCTVVVFLCFAHRCRHDFMAEQVNTQYNVPEPTHASAGRLFASISAPVTNPKHRCFLECSIAVCRNMTEQHRANNAAQATPHKVALQQSFLRPLFFAVHGIQQRTCKKNSENHDSP